MRRMLATLGVVSMAAVVSPAPVEAEEEKVCEPACEAGATCVNGTCMVPAQQAKPAPAPSQAPAAPPPQAYAPGYPPPQAYAPGYPPPGYQYPPPYAYPPRPMPAPARPPRVGFLALPYAGIHSFSGSGTNGLDPGLRLGAILGGAVSEIFSVNGEATIDVMNPSSAGADASEDMATLAFSPLFHARSGSAEIVIGPKLGLWALSGHASNGITTVDVDEQGWTIGGNAGVFFPVGTGTASLGMLLSFANLQVSHFCATVTGYGEMCSSDVSGDVNVLGMTFAALF
jgi:hypothetical protein